LVTSKKVGKAANKPSVGKPGIQKTHTTKKAATQACTRAALVQGVVSTYGDLLKTKGDGTVDRDHIPSSKALEKRAAKLAGRKLTSAEKRRVKNSGKAITLPKPVHKSGRTFGGKNTDTQTTADASGLSKAAKADVDAYRQQGVDAPTLKKMDGMVMTDAEYDKMLLNAVNDT